MFLMLKYKHAVLVAPKKKHKMMTPSKPQQSHFYLLIDLFRHVKTHIRFSSAPAAKYDRSINPQIGPSTVHLVVGYFVPFNDGKPER